MVSRKISIDIVSINNNNIYNRKSNTKYEKDAFSYIYNLIFDAWIGRSKSERLTERNLQRLRGVLGYLGLNCTREHRRGNCFYICVVFFGGLPLDD